MNTTMPACPICHQALSVQLARGRRSGKPFIMTICPQDGRHFRGFISDRTFVRGVLERLEAGKMNEGGDQ